MEPKEIEMQLKEASDGLLMMSETDAPFEFYRAGNLEGPLDHDTVRRLATVPAGYPLEEVELEHFFRNMTRARPDSGEAGMRQAKRFEELQKRLRQLLQGVRVYRLGEAQKLVLILGRTSGGEVAGLKTTVVET